MIMADKITDCNLHLLMNKAGLNRLDCPQAKLTPCSGGWSLRIGRRVTTATRGGEKVLCHVQ